MGDWYNQARLQREACNEFPRASQALKQDRSGVDEKKLKTELKACRDAGLLPEP